MKQFSLQLLLLFIGVTYAQDNVSSILEKSITFYNTQTNYKFNSSHKMYYQSNGKDPDEAIFGTTIKNNNDLYVQHANTVQLYDQGKLLSLKIYEKEKTIEVFKVDKSQLKINAIDSQIKMFRQFLKYFKDQEVVDLGEQYLCRLSSGEITPLPYGRIELYINKSDYSISKQVVYMLSQHTYQEHGKTKVGNPRLEVEYTNYTKELEESDKAKLLVSNYVNHKRDTYTGVLGCLGYRIIVKD